MPYKDKQKSKEAAAERQRKHRQGVTQGGVTEQGVTEEMVPESYVQGLNGRMYEVLPERPRYLTLSDGQVLDRANQPRGHTSGDHILRMRACNESAYNFHPKKATK